MGTKRVFVRDRRAAVGTKIGFSVHQRLVCGGCVIAWRFLIRLDPFRFTQKFTRLIQYDRRNKQPDYAPCRKDNQRKNQQYNRRENGERNNFYGTPPAPANGFFKPDHARPEKVRTYQQPDNRAANGGDKRHFGCSSRVNAVDYG